MSLLSPLHLASVAHITVQPPGRPAASQGTAFCFFDAIDDQDPGSIYVVTCAHLFEKMPSNALTVVRFNTDTGLRNMIAAREDWAVDSRADVAVLPLNVNFLEKQGVNIWVWQKDNIITRHNAEPKGIVEGEEVFILGYPLGWRPATLDYPIVRSGMIGQIRGWIDGQHNSILVSGTVFNGNSGGPVLLKPQPGGMEGTPIRTHIYILGMVSSYRRIFTPDNPMGGENSGIMEIIPMDTIYSIVAKHTRSDQTPYWVTKDITFAVTANASGPNCEITVPTK